MAVLVVCSTSHPEPNRSQGVADHLGGHLNYCARHDRAAVVGAKLEIKKQNDVISQQHNG